jgi:hypothetical protein
MHVDDLLTIGRPEALSQFDIKKFYDILLSAWISCYFELAEKSSCNKRVFVGNSLINTLRISGESNLAKRHAMLL